VVWNTVCPSGGTALTLLQRGRLYNGILCRRSQTQKATSCMIPLYGTSRAGMSTGTESGLGVLGAEGRSGRGWFLSEVTRTSYNCGNGCTVLQAY
jgi:hypothetical protein